MLEVDNLAVRYGRHMALSGVSAKVDKGEICVVLGANGAGKSSMLKAVAGMVRAEPGSRISMNGRPITGMKPHLIVEEGIALVPEGRGIFGDLTVAENLQLGAFARRARRHEAATLDQILALFPRLAERRGQVVRTMSGGEQQMVAIGRALMSKPDILMLDEPSLGLSPILSKDLFKSLAAVAETGVGVLLVEQNARLSLKIARRGYLIENGGITGEGRAEALMRDPAVVNAYLGGGAARGRTPRISVPPSGLALPSGLAGLGQAIGDIAARAGAIQAAFVRALRREGAPASAFVGRYDAAGEPDPWTAVALAAARRPRVPEDASRLAGEAGQLAARAAERLASHLRGARLTEGRGGPLQRAAPVAGDARPPQPEPPALPPLPDTPRKLLGPSAEPPRQHRHAADVEGLAARAAERSAARFHHASSSDAAALAARAADRLAAHLRRQREARTTAPAAATGHVPPPPASPRNPLIGHNSAGAPADDEPAARPRKDGKAAFAATVAAAPDDAAAPTGSGWALASDDSPQDYIGDLAARASAVSAAHYAERRRLLTVHTIPAKPSGKKAAKAAKAGSKHSRNPAGKKRKKQKEA